jgi:glycine cleavage system H protein
MIAPMSGVVIESNMALENKPELINESSEELGWITKIVPDDLSELDRLMDKDEYLKFLDSVDFDS